MSFSGGMSDTVTYASGLGEALGPFLLWLRGLGFFEAYVYIPVMTAASIVVFWRLYGTFDRNRTFGASRLLRIVWLGVCYALCFLACNSLAVAFKTLIVEELDYTGRVWFEAYVSPLHFFITAAALAYLLLIVRNRRAPLDYALGLFVQVGLVAGYGVGVHRLLNEPFSLADPTTGISGLVFFAWFGLYNFDLYRRFVAGNRRLQMRLASIGSPGLAAVLLALAVSPLAGQGGAAGAVPATPWGDPDLQGVWEYWTFTPLEKPAELAGKDVLTDEEAALIAQRLSDEAVGRDDTRPAEGQTGGYNQSFWTERSRATALTQPSLLVDPPDGRIPARTEAEQRRAEAHRAAGERPVRLRATGVGSDGPEDRGLAERCIVGFSTGPPMLPGGYNNNIQVFQAPGYVVIVAEMVHDVRVVPLDGRPHLPPAISQWLGSSRGRWEGNTLVVETTNFTPKIASFSPMAFDSELGSFRSMAFGTGDSLHLTERFTRTDAGTLEYEFTIDDPRTFTRALTGRLPMNRSDLPLYEYACHEGNYGLLNILAGARAEEARE